MVSELLADQRREARIALAMLPVGVIVLVAAVLAFVAVLALAIVSPFAGRAALGWVEAWCLLADVVAVRNARAGIEMMSAFDWRPLPVTLFLSVVVVAAWLALP